MSGGSGRPAPAHHTMFDGNPPWSIPLSVSAGGMVDFSDDVDLATQLQRRCWGKGCPSAFIGFSVLSMQAEGNRRAAEPLG